MTFVSAYSMSVNEYGDSAESIIGYTESFAGLGLMAGPSIGAVLYGLIGFMGIHLVCGGVILVLALPSLSLFKGRDDSE